MKYGKLVDNNIVEYKPYKGGLQLNGRTLLNPNSEQLLKAGYYPIIDVAGEGVDEIVDNELIHYTGYVWGVDEARQDLLNKIDEYDTSNNVNAFYINNEMAWIPREVRVSLQNSTNILLRNNIDTVVLWNDINKYELSCEGLLFMLDTIEIYALKCFNRTAEHKANVLQLNTIEEIESYDYTTGYPDKLSFSV